MPPNALTKEIQLTQDLLTLLIEYQIPSDLFSVSDATHDPEHSRLERVQMHVAELMKMIAEDKLKPIIDTVLPLEDTAKGVKLLEDREVIGKIIITP